MPATSSSLIFPKLAKALTAPRQPFISIIVPVRNEEKFIARLLSQLLQQQRYDVTRFEVLVADGQSTDHTRQVVADFQRWHPNLRLLDNPKQYSSAGRNVAVREARGDIVLLVDGHCELDNPNYLRDLADVFASTGADCVGRPQPLDVPGATPLQRAIAAARASRLGHNPDSYIYSSTEKFVRPHSVAVAYRRAVFDRIGLFDERFDACEDVEFNHRVEQAGFRCYFTPRVKVRYFPRTSLRGLFHQMARYGRGRVRLFRKHPETFTLACALPALFLLGVVVGPLTALLSPWLGLAYLAGFGLYALAILVTSGLIARKKQDWRLLPWLPLVFPMIHFGAGFGILKELVKGLGRTRRLKWLAWTAKPAR